MAESVGGGEGGGGGGRHHQKKRAKKLSTRIDMTPMVDLGFLLLTFFMLTTTFSKPKAIDLTPPVKSKDTTKLQDTTALTLVLSSNNKIYYYNGVLVTSPDSNNIKLTNFSQSGIRALLLYRNHYVDSKVEALDQKLAANAINQKAYDTLKTNVQSEKNALFVIVRTDSAARYVNVINILDELNICNVDKYAVVDANPNEIMKIREFNYKNNVK
jgi:biopolymer transport protein ExbD